MISFPMKLPLVVASLLSLSSLFAADSAAPARVTLAATGTGPGWRALAAEDFAAVNSAPDTWSWKADGLHCTGQPVSVLRTAKEYVNFEMVVEWMHLKSAGNSGVFVLATPASIEKLTKEAKPGLPDGIEVQILDHGFKEQYLKNNPKRAPDWFTTNGDVFAVRVKLNHFEPRSPNGRRNSQTRSKPR